MLTADDWTAIGTLALAAVTAGTAVTSIVLARNDRKHDDEKRAEDRKHDDDKRAEDRRRDDEKRAEDRKRDDDKRAKERAYEAGLRAEQAAALEAAALADRRDREDRDAREVVVRTEGINQVNSSGPNMRVILSALNVSPVKQVQGALVRPLNGGLFNVTQFSNLPVQEIGEDRTYYTFTVATTGPGNNYPLVRFVDWNGNLYYQFRHYTMRFDPGTEWDEALSVIDKWSRDGAQRTDD